MLNKFTIFGDKGKMNNALVEVGIRENILVERFKRVNYIEKVEGQIIIDFSVPEAGFDHFQIAQKYKKAILICTTGHKNLNFLHETSVPVCYAPNTSLEWLIIKRTAVEIEKNSDDNTITVDDIHHASKKDAPSGTALDLISNLNKSRNIIRSIRGPAVSSWHKISFYNEDQIIHLEHQVLDRRVYALGAIKLAMKLILKEPGLYTPEDLLSDC
jgi:4-hydroxy-tetrahydrodipicolinate reductase